jgi:SAM-dependent methyltransferase
VDIQESRRANGGRARRESASVETVEASERLLALSTVFKDIYERQRWGDPTGSQSPFHSGPGSREPSVVTPYVNAMTAFLQHAQVFLGYAPVVADLGCGDFYVGSQLRPHCSGYIACDVVEELIAFNSSYYESLDVDFRVYDLTAEPVPQADIVFVRQVLQHLSNTDVAAFLDNVVGRAPILVVTEHLPAGPFFPNVDKAANEFNRLYLNSGVVLTAPPFNLKPLAQTQLCSANAMGGLIQTIAYRLA